MARLSLMAANSIYLERHAYCLCLHVRPATIFVAVMNLSGSILCALLTFFFMINNDFGRSSTTSSSSSNYFANRFVRDEMNRINLISVLMYLLLSLVSAMLLYGVIKSKPRYVLPFFGIQFIDYLFTLQQFFASMTHPYHYYVSKSKQIMDLQQQQPGDQFDSIDTTSNMWSKYPPEGTTVSGSTTMSASNIYSTSLMILTLIMIFKTYFLCVVWKCYRYLHMKEMILPVTLNTSSNGTNFFGTETILPTSLIVNNDIRSSSLMASNVAPPDYEEATKLPECKPPEYASIIGDNPIVCMPNESTATSTPATVAPEPASQSQPQPPPADIEAGSK